MKQKLILLATVLFLFKISFTQSVSSTDTSVKVFPHWKKGETHNVSIKSSTTDFSNGKSASYLSTYNAKFFIAEKDSSGYIVEWTYTKATLDPNEITIENSILANLLDTKLIFRLSLIGKFKELVNVEEVKTATDKAIDKLIAGSENNHVMNVQFKAAKQLVGTKQGLEIVLLKQIKFYNLSFGYNYKTNYTRTNKLKLPNPLGGQPFDALEKVQLTRLDNSKSICVVETSKTVDGTVLKNEVVEYLKKASKQDSKSIEDELQKEPVEFTENTMQQIDFSKGIIQKSNFTRKMNFGFQNRVTVMEIESND